MSKNRFTGSNTRNYKKKKAIIWIVFFLFQSSVFNSSHNGSIQEQEAPGKRQDFSSHSAYPNLSKPSFQKPFDIQHIQKLNRLIDNGSVLVLDKEYQELLNYYSEEWLLPASTLKILTSLFAIENLGIEYRFFTDLYLDSQNNLYIYGYGDPIFTSSEMERMVKNLKKMGIKGVQHIYLDASYLPEWLAVPGNEDSYASHDAKNSSLAINFNTISFRKWRKNRRSKFRLLSGEKETPLVPYALKIFKKSLRENRRLSRARSFRIAMKEQKDSLFYYGDMLKFFLEKHSISMKGQIKLGRTPNTLELFYRHYSQITLKETIQSLLEFSNNFIANQVLLTTASHIKKKGTTLNQAIQTLSEFTRKKLGISDIRMVEGSGISYGNRIHAQSLSTILKAFKPHQKLLKKFEVKGHNENLTVLAKTGTLRTTFALAGYLDSPDNRDILFVILLNQSANERDTVLKMLADTLSPSTLKQ